MENKAQNKAYFHLPGLFEFYELYSVFLPLYHEHREYFYDWCEIASVYGAPADCIWGGGRVGFGECEAEDVLALMNEYGVSSRLAFSNSLLNPEHLTDRKCNALCELFTGSKGVQNGVIIHSDLLLEHIKNNYPSLYFVSSTTKVQTDFDEFLRSFNYGVINATFTKSDLVLTEEACTTVYEDAKANSEKLYNDNKIYGTYLLKADGQGNLYYKFTVNDCSLVTIDAKSGSIIKSHYWNGDYTYDK